MVIRNGNVVTKNGNGNVVTKNGNGNVVRVILVTRNGNI